MKDAPIAVVVRGEANGLGVVRSLAEGGVPTVVVDTTRKHAAMWSRWARSVVVDQLFGRPFVDSLLELQRKLGGRPVLILTDEMAVNTVSEHRDELSPFYRFHMPSPAMVTTLGNKALFQEFAEHHDLPVPRTAVMRSRADLASLSGFQFPVIAKPADKRAVYLGEIERINRIGSLDEANTVCRRMLDTASEIVVQEWIEGGDGNIYFALFHSSRSPNSESIFFGRKVRCHPPRVGTTAVCVAAPEAEALLSPLVKKFIEDAQYEGLGSLEFKWDEVALRFVIIEPTVGRSDWQEEIATLNGANLPLIAYRHELGLPLKPQAQAERPAAWCESFRYWSARAELAPGVRAYDCYWRVNDPMPAVIYYCNFVLGYLTRWVMRPAAGRTAPVFDKIKGAT